MNEKIKRIQNWTQGKKEYPITIELNPTNRCNSHCVSCWLMEFKPENEELSQKKMLDIIRESAILGVKEVRILGSGEPLMKEGIMDVLKDIKKKNMKGLLITNGTLLDEKKSKELIAMQWDCITFSVDGPNAETHDYLRGFKGCFEAVIRNLSVLNKMKYLQKKEKPLIRFNVVLSNKNFDKIQEIFELAGTYDCRDVQIQSLTVWGSIGEKLRLSEEQINEFQSNIKKIRQCAHEHGIITNVDSYKSNELLEKTDSMDEIIKKHQIEKNPWLNLPCFEPWYNMIILPDGTVAPCSISGGKYGDTINNKTLKEVWFGEQFANLRKNLLENNLPVYCKKCCVVVYLENKKIKEELKIRMRDK